MANFSNLYSEPFFVNVHPAAVVLDAVPKQIRDFFADYLWLTADEYMHFGPSKKLGQRFLAGSFAGNTEIMPLLELAIIFEPRHIDAYGIISQNLTFYLDHYIDGIRLLQRGIHFNKESHRLHELYASIGFCYGFVNSYKFTKKNDRYIALRYFDAALKAYEQNHGEIGPQDDVFGPRNYNVIRARFLVERGEKEKALQAWYSSGLDLHSAPDALAQYLRKVEGGEEVPNLPEELPEIKAYFTPRPLERPQEPPDTNMPELSSKNEPNGSDHGLHGHTDGKHSDQPKNTLRNKIIIQTVVLAIIAIGLCLG